MSYLLTEIAMEMLGWQFYDTDGVPRPINLEGLNLATTEGAEPLEQALDIHFLDKKLSIKAEADSSCVGNGKDTKTQEAPFEYDANIDLPYTNDAATQETYSESDDSKSSEPHNEDSNKESWKSNVETHPNEDFIIKNVSNNALPLKIQSVVGGVSLENDQEFQDNEANFHTPLTHSKPSTPSAQEPTVQEVSALTISKIQQNDSQIQVDSKEKPPKSFSPNWNVISMTKLPIDQNGAGTSEKKSHTETSTFNAGHFDLKQKMESEMFKAALDLNREKALFLKSLDSATKKNTQKFRKALENYRTQELNNLQNELKNLFQLRQHAEQLSASKFPTTFPKYLKRSNALSSNELLESAELTMPILSVAKEKKNHESAG